MLTVIFICALASTAAGLAAKIAIDRFNLFVGRITWPELIAGSLAASLIVAPLVTWAGFAIARSSAVTYNEYYSGFEKTAVEKITRCERDGSCRYEYDCDPYQVAVTKTRSVYAGTDSKGNAQYRTETYVEMETHYHRCPYVKTEHTFEVTDTLGDTYTIGSHWFPENPEKHKWRDRSLPRVPSGTPKFWAEAKARIDSGNPGGTTKRAKYKNYILASQDDILSKSSSAVATYLKSKTMPKVATEVHDFYLADKAYFPTGTPDGSKDDLWQEAVMRLNGRIGGEKHGDLHLVLVDAVKIPAADEYSQALEAYWQSDALGKNTLSKNGIVIVAGYSNGVVDWARSFTGMPVGNEGFAVAVREQLPGVEATPATLANAIDGLVFAPQPSGFKRVEMADFDYLFASIQPSGSQRVWIAVVGFLLALPIWAVMVYIDFDFLLPFRKYRNN